MRPAGRRRPPAATQGLTSHGRRQPPARRTRSGSRSSALGRVRADARPQGGADRVRGAAASLACDPDNALVRVELAHAYNELLVEVARAQDALEAERLAHSPETEDEVLARVEGLERDFRAVWDDPEGDAKTKKRLLGTIVDSVTLTRVGSARTCLAQVLYSGGGTDEFTAPYTFYGRTPELDLVEVRDYLTPRNTAPSTRPPSSPRAWTRWAS